MNWRQFCSPQQNKIFNTQRINIEVLTRNSKSKTKLSHNHSSNRKQIKSNKSETPKLQQENYQDSISQLFFNEIAITDALDHNNKQFDIEILNTLTQLKNISKQNLQYQKKMLRALEDSLVKKQNKSKSTIKKSRKQTLQTRVNTKIKELQKLKSDLQTIIKKSSSQKTKKKEILNYFK